MEAQLRLSRRHRQVPRLDCPKLAENQVQSIGRPIGLKSRKCRCGKAQVVESLELCPAGTSSCSGPSAAALRRAGDPGSSLSPVVLDGYLSAGPAKGNERLHSVIPAWTLTTWTGSGSGARPEIQAFHPARYSSE
jgi:hypothetical protein